MILGVLVGSDEVEEAAVNYIKDLLLDNDHLAADLSVNDKTPIIDGEIRFYSPDKKSKTKNFQWAVSAQCKGRQLKSGERFKNSAKFRLKREYLTGFQKYDGVILFLVLIKGRKRRAYYLILGPLDIAHELSKMGNRKSRVVSLSPFPDKHEEQNKIAALAHEKCQPNRFKLTNEVLPLATGFRVSALEDIDFSRPGKIGIGTGVPSHIEMTLRDGNRVPLDGFLQYWPNDYVPHELGSAIQAGSIVISDAHRRRIDENQIELAITPSLKITFDATKQTGIVKASSVESFDETLRNLEFLQYWRENQSFDIGETKVHWKLNDSDFKSIDDSLRILKDVDDLCAILGVDTSLLRIEQISEASEALENIVKYFLYNGRLKLPEGLPRKIIVELGQWQLRFFAFHESGQDYATIQSISALDSQQFWWVPNDNPESYTRITVFETLTAEEISTTLNLDLQHIVEAYKWFVDVENQAGFANDTVLKLIEAADLLPIRGDELLRGARQLAAWPCEHQDFSEIAKINVWQIDKRLGTLTDTDLNDIRIFRESLETGNDYVAPLKAGASALLGLPEEVAFWLEQSDETNRIKFKQTPIYCLLTTPQIVEGYQSLTPDPNLKWEQYKTKCLDESALNEFLPKQK
ncbi:hypothetical protein ACGLFO_03325, partial [Corynebacterium hesseae]|uniref:hypothetical protein n=1 Tax=Corynebacterium hesseae TaxID=2913502 RepID=UPI00373F0ED4